jgi:hypothetical protein
LRSRGSRCPAGPSANAITGEDANQEKAAAIGTAAAERASPKQEETVQLDPAPPAWSGCGNPAYWGLYKETNGNLYQREDANYATREECERVGRDLAWNGKIREYICRADAIAVTVTLYLSEDAYLQVKSRRNLACSAEEKAYDLRHREIWHVPPGECVRPLDGYPTAVAGWIAALKAQDPDSQPYLSVLRPPEVATEEATARPPTPAPKAPETRRVAMATPQYRPAPSEAMFGEGPDPFGVVFGLVTLPIRFATHPARRDW